MNAAIRTPVQTLLSRGSIYTLGFALQVSAGVLVLPAVTRVLPPEELGAVAVAAVVAQIVSHLGRAGLPAALVRAYFMDAHGPARARSLVFTTGISALLVALAAELSGPLWSHMFSDLRYGGALRLAVWSSVPFAVHGAAQGLLRAADRPGRFVVSSLPASVGAVGLGVALAAAWEPDAAHYMLGMLIGYVLAAITSTTLAGVRIGHLRRDAALTRWALAFGLPTVSHSLAMLVLAAGDRIVLMNLEGAEAVGRYEVAYRLGSLGILLVTAVNFAWSPLIYATALNERWNVLARTSAVLHRMAALTVGGLVLATPLALQAMAPGYGVNDLVIPTNILALATLPYLGYVAPAIVAFERGKTVTLAWATPLAAMTNVGLNLLLIPLAGLAGAAAATLMAYGMLAIIVWRRSRRLVQVSWYRREWGLAWALSVGFFALGLLAFTVTNWATIPLGALLLLSGTRVFREFRKHDPKVDVVSPADAALITAEVRNPVDLDLSAAFRRGEPSRARPSASGEDGLDAS